MNGAPKNQTVPPFFEAMTTTDAARLPRGHNERSARRVPVFYRPEQATPPRAVRESPSAAKPAAVIESWKRIEAPLAFRSFEPLTRRELSLAHSPAYVDAVLDLEEPNGFGTCDAEVATTLPYTSGAFVAAALCAWAERGVAVAPVSGFHHAEYELAGGYCTFNGLAIAARRLLQAGAKRVGILDCDAHFGNGTEDILSRVPALRGRVEHFTRGMAHYRGPATDAPEFLAHLPRLLEAWHRQGVDIVLFQAGVDPHVDDPIGCRFLTTAQLFERDRLVFDTCVRVGLPVAWNLAGGYQEDPRLDWPRSIRPVLELHDNTMRACVQAHERAGT